MTTQQIFLVLVYSEQVFMEVSTHQHVRTADDLAKI